MARSSNQKLKLLYLMDYLLRRSDETHPVTMRDLLSYLESLGIAAERKSVYDDIEALRQYGLDVELTRIGRESGYYVAERDFQLPELKLLVDSVQSSKFITHKKTSDLIKKIETLGSIYDAQLLDRQVYVKNRIKTMNESIYYNVDEIHTGISRGKKIRFRYFEYAVDKSRRYRRDGAWYTVSPFGLTWDDENYYLVAYDTETAGIRHYRVDKMTDIRTTDEPRDGTEAYKELDMAVYSRQVFGMFSGEIKSVTMRFRNHLAGPVIDRLGRDVMLIPDGDEHFTVTVDVAVSPQFFAWLSGFGAEAVLIAPEAVVEDMRKHVRELYKVYG